MKLNEQRDPVTHVLSETCNPSIRLNRRGRAGKEGRERAGRGKAGRGRAGEEGRRGRPGEEGRERKAGRRAGLADIPILPVAGRCPQASLLRRSRISLESPGRTNTAALRSNGRTPSRTRTHRRTRTLEVQARQGHSTRQPGRYQRRRSLARSRRGRPV